MIMKLQIYFLILIDQKTNIWLIEDFVNNVDNMIMFFVYINNILKNQRSIFFSDTIWLTEPSLSILRNGVSRCISISKIIIIKKKKKTHS